MLIPNAYGFNYDLLFPLKGYVKYFFVVTLTQSHNRINIEEE